ncbi:hypothetical protein ACJMK2_028625 [Sinanodonta woodiana]|uniref:Transmembrane protein 45B n=1 Tax=Sinanodonta woodiana TaxID=1069815 RepID=A0ABD3XB91_SINWO
MGSFGGHVLPGSFFIVIAIWWIFHIFNRYYGSRRRNSQFTSSAIYPCSCLSGWVSEWPFEAAVKIFFVVIGFSLEIYTGFSEGRFVNIGNGQHATMFFYFGLTGIIDILTYYRAPLPPDTDYVMMSMALIVEGLLFKFHLHGRADMDVLLHTLLIYTIGANIVSIFVEMKYRHNVLAPLSRSYFLLLQGTWFYQIAFILYNPIEGAMPWDLGDHEQMMIVTMYFTWHAGLDILIILAIGGAVACVHRRLSPYAEETVSMKRLIHTSPNGQTFVSLNDDSESETEFQTPMNVSVH